MRKVLLKLFGAMMPKAKNYVRVPNEQINPELLQSIFSKKVPVSDAEVAQLLSRPMPDISLRGEIKAYMAPVAKWLDKKIVKPFQYLMRRGFKTSNKMEGPVTIPSRDLPPEAFNKIYIESEGAKEIMEETAKIYSYRYC